MTDAIDTAHTGGPEVGGEAFELPASFAQERLWFVTQLEPDLAVYNLGCPVELSWFGGDQDPDALRAALADVVGRHESLRTALVSRDGKLVALVHPEIAVDVPERDLRSGDPAEVADAVAALAAAESAVPFDLATAPLWRAVLVRRADDDWLLLFVVHHAVFDAQSVRVFVRELADCYTARRDGRVADLPELPIQYGDFAGWQRDRLAGGDLDEQLEHWRSVLTDLPEPLRLPSVGDESAGHNAGGHVGFTVPAGVGTAVRELARVHGTTPFVVLLAGFAAVLGRVGGTRDLLVGSPVSGRVLPELNGLVGMFVNTLLLRVRLGGGGFAELVARTREVVLDAVDNQEFPYDRLVELVAPHRVADGSPPHQVVFNLLPISTNSQVRNGTAKADLLVDLAEDGAGYDGVLEFRRTLFDAPAAAALAAAYVGFLERACADPDTPLDRVALSTPEAPDTPVLPAGDRCTPVTDLFAAVAQEHAGAIAVRDAGGAALTYAELDRRSAALAGHLVREHGAGPDTVVAILLDNVVDLPVAVLGVLRAGAAYLPLDLRHPPDRMRHLLADSGAVAVLTQTKVPARAHVAAVPVVTLDTIEPPAPGPLRTPLPDALAYVVYTSGSTGAPKGVGVSHRNLAAYVDEVHRLLAPAPGSVFSLLQTLTFDFGLTAFYGALTAGGTLHLAPRDFAADARWVADHLRTDRVDYLKITPSHLLALRAGADPAELLPARALILGGEATRGEFANELRRLAADRGCAVVNHYGPTETTVGALAFPGDREPWPRSGLPLGWPLAHARADVLDTTGAPVPDGLPGELFLAGATVSRGYLGQAALTAERFVPDPAGPPGARRYRTGDRARRLPDGSVEFLGRVDDQVKVRGHRVELGEVRHALAEVPDVADAFATLHTTDADAVLVGYLVPASGAVLDERAVRARLEQRLPEFMVPAVLVEVGELPLTPHGKVDRARLPEPGSVVRAAGAGAAPADDVEDLVAGIFEALLNRRDVRRDDHFFRLGGHSLLAIQMVTRLRVAFGVAVPLRRVFADPTVAGIAAQVRGKRAARPELPAVDLVPRDRPAPVSYGQRRLWFVDQLEGLGPQNHTPVCLRVRGELDVALLRRAFTALVERHELLRARFRAEDGELHQVFGAQAQVPWRVVDSQDDLLAEAERPFDLATEPPLRVALARVAADEHLVLVTLHHIVNDAWSANLLVRELGALAAAEPVALPELPVQYADYAAWQRRMVDGPAREPQIAYWRERLAGMPELLALPTDRPRPPRRGFAGGHVGFRVPRAVADRLRAVGADEGASLFMVLLSGFLVLLGQHTGSRDLVVGTPSSNRSRPEFEQVLGFFLNTLVLRTDTSGAPTFRELVRRVRDTVLGAFAHQDLPFEVLVDELAPRHDLANTPLVQVLFTLEDAERAPVSAPDGPTFEWVPFGTRTAKFDLTVYLWRRADGLTGAFEYRTDLFDEATIDGLTERFTALLGAAAADPDRVADLLPAHTQDDLLRLASYNDTGTVWPGPDTVPARLAERVAATPAAPALVWWAEGRHELDYAGLGARVTRLARLLRARGVRPGDTVGVLLERGPELPVAVHAITALGAVYLPLDPENPDARLAVLVAAGGAGHVVTVAALAPRLPEVTVVAVDEPGTVAELAATDPGPLDVVVDPLWTAYLLFTSGSTGVPKPVAVSHGALANRLRWMQEELPIGPGDPVAHKTPIGFDVSLWELCWPLVEGAPMVLVPPGAHRDPLALAEVLAAEDVRVAHFVPSMLSAFLDSGPALPGLRTLVASGEALSPRLAQRCAAVLPGAELVNLYGPTEAAVDVTLHRVVPGAAVVPIGAPVANTRVHVVDADGRRTPPGVPGELCLAGVQLADGYRGRPAETADRFRPDPHGPAGSRRYHTGDLGRWLPNGELEYLGRLDDQVKVRGRRIEPGEVEAALTASPTVAAAAVVAVPTGQGDAVLHAHLVPADPADPPTREAVTARLRAVLPEHLVPAAIGFLDALPVTANGKLDRSALPDLAGETGHEHVPPAGGPELALAAAWSDVLGRDRIGALDDFFGLGGDSIRALKVVARVLDAGYRLELAEMFLHPTLRELAATLVPAVDGDRRGTAPFELVPSAVADAVRGRYDAEDAYPLTALQEGMLFHSEFAEGAATYHDVFTLRIGGDPYDADAMAHALAEQSARHPVLRTSLHLAEFDEPVQVVHRRGGPVVTHTDLTAAADAEAVLAGFTAEERHRGFDLAQAPLLRVFTHLMPGGGVALTLSFHHAILDGWSVAVLTTALLRGYTARLAGTVEPGGPVGALYRDFVAGQLAMAAAPEPAAFWRATLADAPHARLPRAAGAATGRGTGSAAVLRADLPADLVAALTGVARQCRVPLRTALLAAHLRVLGLFTGQSDVVGGTVTHSRPAVEDGERVLGLFLNTVPVRARVDQPTWWDLVRAVHRAEAATVPHRGYPLPLVQRAADRVPAYDVLFDYRDFHVYGDLPDDRVRVEGYEFFEQTDIPFAANMIRSPGGDGLAVQLKYDSAQFDADQVEHLMRGYLAVLSALATDPDGDPRTAIDLLTGDTAAVTAWNDTARPLPGHTVPGLLVAAAEAHAATPALFAGQEQLSYADLATRVGTLARRLLAGGVAPGDVVGVCLHRGTDLVVAVHAVMAAGAAYLPLEPEQPPLRLADMLADAGATLVVTTTALAAHVPDAAHLLVDDLPDGQSDDAPLPEVHPDSTAYVIFTSGSTGRPKGVAVPHRALANRLAWMQEHYPIDAGDRVLHKTPFGFDVSVWELCWPLLHGAAVVLADPGGHRDPAHLTGLVRERDVTVVHFVPSMLDVVLEEPDVGAAFAGLRHLFCSGEALDVTVADRLHAVAPHVRLHNLYGPTEAAIDVTAHTHRPGEQTMPIGRAVANTRTEVLDARGYRVPVGTPGELCLAGVQLAHGYLGRPDLTADRFRPDRYGPPGSRLYRTGDAVRWLPTGELAYLGRLDRQVKIRGFRVEPGEVEARLRAVPGVRAAAVLVDAGRLVAYLVGEDGPVTGIGDRLRERLPEYLVPGAVVWLDELPTTGNGKLDHAALPAPAMTAAEHVPPDGPLETAVAEVWAQVLGVPGPGALADFFAVGGDSIRSLKVVARLRAMGHRIAVRELYAHPTVRALAAHLAAGTPADPPADTAPTEAFALLAPGDLALLDQRYGGTRP